MEFNNISRAMVEAQGMADATNSPWIVWLSKPAIGTAWYSISRNGSMPERPLWSSVTIHHSQLRWVDPQD